MRRRHFLAALTALVMSVAVPASALAGCMADSKDTITTQMACCKTAKLECRTASKGTMECCKTGHHPDQQNIAKVLTDSNPLKFASVSPASTVVQPPLLPARPTEPVMLFAGTTSPPRLAFSALLI
jgi:hypothetical protein